MGIARNVSEELLRNTAKESFSQREVIIKLGYPNAGGNHITLKKLFKRYDIDVSHFTGEAHQKGKSHNRNKKIPLEEILVENSTYNRRCLKNRLLKKGILKNECSICGQGPEWNGKPLVMVIDHINGINNDHRLENLRIVCRHCDSQLSTFCGKNIKKRRRKKEQRYCKKCNGKITIHSKTGFCKSCFNKGRAKNRPDSRKVPNRPSPSEIEEMLKTMSWTAIGRKYGVSDNAIRKWMK